MDDPKHQTVERQGLNPAFALLALMRELEGSLERSRQALLALDLGGVEQGTGEQIELVGKIQAALGRVIRPETGRAPVQRCAPGTEQCGRGPENELQEELRHSGNRILQAARLQAALLARAQWKLRVLANMLAGTSVRYGPRGWLSSPSRQARPLRAGGEQN
jgi:hypothetical protein